MKHLDVRNVKYRDLPELQGKKITVSSFAAVTKEVLDGLNISFSPCPTLATPTRELSAALGKYGILDLEFECADILGMSDLISRSQLRNLGFFDRPLRTEMKAAGGADPTCVSLLIEDLNVQKSFLKLFLESDPNANAMHRVVREYESDLKSGASAQIDDTIARLVLHAEEGLPLSFVVTDACLTNSTFVWFHRHLWM